MSPAGSATDSDQTLGPIPAAISDHSTADALDDKAPDPVAVRRWRRSAYEFLTTHDGPPGMFHETEVALFTNAGFWVHHGDRVEITPLGHAIGGDTATPLDSEIRDLERAMSPPTSPPNGGLRMAA